MNQAAVEGNFDGFFVSRETSSSVYVRQRTIIFYSGMMGLGSKALEPGLF